MALTKVGLGAEINVNPQGAVRGMGQARDALGRFTRATGNVNQALGRTESAATRAAQRIGQAFVKAGEKIDKFGQSMRSVAMATAGATVAVGAGVKQAADFQQGMADLGAVVVAGKNPPVDAMERLTAKAKEMGIITAFSASESADAMQELARAGATVEEQVGGIKGVLDLAAAGNVSYQESAMIVSNITRAMGREFKDSTQLADVLAMTSARTNVTVTSLGDAFRYAAPQAKIMGMTAEETAAVLGKLGDAGLRGSIGGTSFANMMRKLAKPSTKAKKIMQEFGIELENADGSLRPIADIIGQFSSKIGSMTSAMDKAAIMTEVFGMRGAKAFGALMQAGSESIASLNADLEEAAGVADKMARTRLETLKGQLKMMAASIEGLSIELFSGLGEGIQSSVTDATTGLNNVLFAIQALKKANKEGADQQKIVNELTAKYGETAIAVAQGVMDTIEFLKDAWNSVVDTIKSVGRALESVIGKSGVRMLVGIIGKVTMLAAVIAPIAAVLAGIAFVLKAVVWPAIIKTGKIVNSTFGRWLILLTLVAKFIGDVSEKAGKKDAAVQRRIDALRQKNAERQKLYAWKASREQTAAGKSALDNTRVAVGTAKRHYEDLATTSERSSQRTINAVSSVGNVGVRSFDTQTRKAIEMAETAGAKYQEVAQGAVDAAGTASEAWVKGAGEVKTGVNEITEAEANLAEEHTGLIGVFVDGWDVATDGAVGLYELLGGTTERVKQQRLEALLLRKEYDQLAARWSKRTGEFRIPMAHEVAGQMMHEAMEEARLRVEKRKAEDEEAMKILKDAKKRSAERRGKEVDELLGKIKEGIEGKKTETNVNIKNTMCLDGKAVGWALTKQQQEIQQRAGAKSKKYQSTLSRQHAALPGTVNVSSS